MTVNTCTADHPRALPTYLRAGFRPLRQVREIWQVPLRLRHAHPRSPARLTREHIPCRIDDRPVETEIKLRLPAAAFDTLSHHALMENATPDQRHEITTYFDTPDLDLARHGFHLRIRRSGTHRLQTLKTADGHAVAKQRGEWEQPVETDTPDLAILADTPAAAALRDIGAERLRPAFTTDIHRTARLLHGEGDATIEAAFDRGVIIAGNRSEPVSELEWS